MSDRSGAESKAKKPQEVDLSADAKEKTLKMTIRLLRFMQLLCEGHYEDLQNHLREQKLKNGQKQHRSFDFVAFTSNMFGVYVKSYVNKYSIVLGNQIIETLIEFI